MQKTSFSSDEHKIIEHTARRVHEALGLGHYSRSDMIMTPQGKIYVLEASSQPFAEGDPLEEALTSAGWSSEEFVDHLIRLAIQKN
jgi:D-alanine-D-alanine ligase-like ATP-grasp enzyme